MFLCMYFSSKMNNSTVDKDLTRDLQKSIKAITHTGLKELDPASLKTIKCICRKSDDYVAVAFKSILKWLRKKHAEVRLSTFQLCIELFDRSRHFRELFTADLNTILELTVETNLKKPLPLPKQAAQNLKKLALETYNTWNIKYGEAYKSIRVAFNYLKNGKKIDFDAMEAENVADIRRRQLEEDQERNIREAKLNKINQEIEETLPEINITLTSLENCISLLIPTLDSFFIPQESDDNIFTPKDFDQSEDNHIDLRSHGISTGYNLKIDINPNSQINIERTTENEPVIENAEDLLQTVVNTYLPKVNKWMKTMTKLEHTGIKDIIDLKEKITKCKEKYTKLNINVKTKDESSDDEFMEVPEKEGYEESVKEPLFENNLFSYEKKSVVANKGKEITPELKSREIEKKLDKAETSDDRKSKLLAVAPKVPFDIDLYHWEDEDLKAPTMFTVKPENHSFWSASRVDDMQDIPVPEGASALRTRVIEFSGQFEPVKRSCRAILPSGKLCPRQDRYKCPFHGAIVDRDDSGKRLDGKDESTEKQSSPLKEPVPEIPDWQDPQLLADIKAATGIDLSMPQRRRKKKKGKKEPQYPGLTNLKGRTNTVYRRLSKKIFKKSSMKRVAADLNKLEKRKLNDKFGDQFNYM